MAEKEIRNFALRDEKGNKIEVFMGRSLLQAVPKGSPGQRVQLDKPKGAPAWMKDKIWKPMVKKVGVEKLEEL